MGNQRKYKTNYLDETGIITKEEQNKYENSN